MIIIGLDNSFSSLGFTKINTELKTVDITRIEGKCGNTIQSIWQNSLIKVTELSKLLPNSPYFAISEEPFPMRESSEKLYMLNGMVYYTLALKNASEIWNVNPSYLNTLLTKSRTKSDSVNLAKELIEVYKLYGYSFNKKRYNDDESESFIFATRLFIRKHNDLKMLNDFFNVKDKLSLEKEKLLYMKK